MAIVRDCRTGDGDIATTACGWPWGAIVDILVSLYAQFDLSEL